MALTYEDKLRIVRDSIATSDIDGNPATFEPPAWAIRAVERAYERGVGESVAAFGTAALYPEGG
jgi:hypothetical protein